MQTSLAWLFLMWYHRNMFTKQPLMTQPRVEKILKDIKYLDWEFFLGGKERLYIQVRFKALDANTGQIGEQRGRKWFLSEHMVPQEIVSTAYAAVERAVLHEMKEQFLLCGKRIYGPHIDPYALLDVADRTEGRT